jgi:signal transduction histidine kinase
MTLSGWRFDFSTVSASSITLIYALVSAGWIAFSDRLLAALVTNRELYTQLQTGKGWAFVVASSVLIYGLVDRREEKLASKNERLERALQQVSVLHRILRHNLRNSCNVIKGYIEMVDGDEEVDSDYLSIVERNVDRMIELSDKSNHLRNIALDGSEAVQPIELHRLLDERIAVLREGHPDVVVNADLSGTVFVRAHSHLGVGLDELLENAVVHNDSPTPTIWISVRSEDERVEVDIADNGSGIPEVEREVVEKGEERPLFHSQGIGLWVARAAVVESGGEIRIVDNEPHGSIARISLPKAAPTDT